MWLRSETLGRRGLWLLSSVFAPLDIKDYLVRNAVQVTLALKVVLVST